MNRDTIQLLFFNKTEQPSNIPPFEQSALYSSVSFGSKIVDRLASDDVLIPKISSTGATIIAIFIK